VVVVVVVLTEEAAMATQADLVVNRLGGRTVNYSFTE
jgi:hypothetical protein